VTGYNTASPKNRWLREPRLHWQIFSKIDKKMSKESIQEVVQKSLEDYFNDLGEQQASNVYDMVVMTVERPILEVRTQPRCWVLTAILCARNYRNTACCKADSASRSLLAATGRGAGWF